MKSTINWELSKSLGWSRFESNHAPSEINVSINLRIVDEAACWVRATCQAPLETETTINLLRQPSLKWDAAPCWKSRTKLMSSVSLMWPTWPLMSSMSSWWTTRPFSLVSLLWPTRPLISLLGSLLPEAKMRLISLLWPKNNSTTNWASLRNIILGGNALAEIWNNTTIILLTNDRHCRKLLVSFLSTIWHWDKSMNRLLTNDWRCQDLRVKLWCCCLNPTINLKVQIMAGVTWCAPSETEIRSTVFWAVKALGMNATIRWSLELAGSYWMHNSKRFCAWVAVVIAESIWA